MEKNKIIYLFIGVMCGIIANGIFWFMQQLNVFSISFNILCSGYIAGLIGCFCQLIKEKAYKKHKK